MVRVTSEVGTLRRVLVHEPEAEVDWMVPAMMEELLFDDILYGDHARAEHAMFRRVLQLFDIEVLEARELLARALQEPEARRCLLESIDEVRSSERLREGIASAPAGELAAWLVHGIRRPGEPAGFDPHELYDLAPIPNWCFQRDPLVVIGEGVVLASMSAAARRREATLTRLLVRFHPDLRGVPVLFDAVAAGAGSLEGGDVLVLSEQVLAVGRSERTSGEGIRALAEALAGLDAGPRHLVIVEIPRRRAYMHLDTLFTPIDRDACLVFSPVLLGRGPEAARVSVLDLAARDRTPAPVEGGLLGALAGVGIDLEPISCGGSDPVEQQREQWTDGANALALAPGVITLYGRNTRTADELDAHGYRVVHAEEVLLGKEELDPSDPGKVCVLVPSHEISRARGGPHCLTHPLLRDELPA